MSQETKQETLTSGSDYWEIDTHNAQLLTDKLKLFFPMLTDAELFDFIAMFPKIIAFEKFRKRYKINYNHLLDYISDVETIKKMGWGEVRTRIQKGQIVKTEGVYTRTYVLEEAETTK